MLPPPLHVARWHRPKTRCRPTRRDALKQHINISKGSKKRRAQTRRDRHTNTHRHANSNGNRNTNTDSARANCEFAEARRVEENRTDEKPRQASRQLAVEFVVVSAFSCHSPSPPLSSSHSPPLCLSLSAHSKVQAKGRGSLGALHSARHKVEQDKSARNGNRGRAVKGGRRRKQGRAEKEE